ncbi:MAG: dephospho-CoA kinase [Bacteroidetes bacterium]|nr:dephospho-CoA kinase [Bacteroidota bacterium]MCW5897009.1 dephospho-CoA kinase [Bacteroidota bacterium]
MKNPRRSPRLSRKRGDSLLVSPGRPLRVGVTGGIGSGKSTVCGLLAAMGRPVLSADDIARGLTDTNNEIQSAIRETFGSTVFLPNGLVDRKALASVVFNNRSLRKTLDAIIHPYVFSAIDVAIGQFDAAVRYVVIEAALIYETGMDKRLDYVVMVNAAEKTRIVRVMSRDNIAREAVEARIRAQMDVKKKVTLADFVIDNDGSENELASRVKFLDTLLSLMNPAKK